MKTVNFKLNESWLHGKYAEINAEINTSLPFVSIDEYFFQGEEANTVIQEIHNIWINGNLTVPEAITQYSNYYL
jgi:hypothetical protein